MARKTQRSLTTKKNEIERKYKRGHKRQARVRGEDSLTQVEREVKQQIACFLKAQDFGIEYIANSTGMSPATIKRWFADEELNLVAQVQEIQGDLLDGAIKLLRNHAIELMEMLLEIARETPDDKVALNAILEGLGMLGITKVNKSESASAQTIREEREIDIVDKTGLVDALRDAPPEIQAQAAQKMEELMSLTAEHTDANVTHGQPHAK